MLFLTHVLIIIFIISLETNITYSLQKRICTHFWSLHFGPILGACLAVFKLTIFFTLKKEEKDNKRLLLLFLVNLGFVWYLCTVIFKL